MDLVAVRFFDHMMAVTSNNYSALRIDFTDAANTFRLNC